MKVEVLKERETPLLSRKRVSLMAEYQGPTPSRMDFLKEVAKIVDSDPSLIIIKHIYTRFGRQKAKIIAHVYSNMDDMKKLEGEYLLKKHVKKEEEKKDQADAAAKDTAAKVEAAEAPTTEAKVEEKKEEPKEAKPEAPAEEKKEEPKAEEKPKEEKPAEQPSEEKSE